MKVIFCFFCVLLLVTTVSFAATTLVVAEDWQEGVQEVFDLLNKGTFVSSAVVFAEDIIVVAGFGKEYIDSRSEPEIRQALMRAVSLRSRAMMQNVLQEKFQWFFLEETDLESLVIEFLQKELQRALKNNWPDIEIKAGQMPPGIQTRIYENREENYFLSVSLLFLWADDRRETLPEPGQGPSGQVSCPDNL